ncbi:MAG: FkbM family methyltransferase [Limnohabitans sp.]|nr:FkbM family methyltransferase [Limnohabitans sp.]
MIKILKAIIQRIFLTLGFKVVKAKDADEIDKFATWLSSFNFATVIDIGANEGQFAHKIRKLLPQVYIHSFEPIPQVFDSLQLLSQQDSRFSAYNTALGNSSGSIEIILNESTAASSILKMTEDAQAHFSFLKEDNNIEISIARLDDFKFDTEIQKPYLVKIDVQGFELEVLKGGVDFIRDAELVIIEVSFKYLYKEQVLFDEIYNNITALGFRYTGSIEQLISPNLHEIIQADAIFVKQKSN